MRPMTFFRFTRVNFPHSKLNANSKLICVECNGSILSDNHDLCVLNDVNACAKSKSVKKNSKRKVWKPTGKVFTNIGYIWRPTGHTFTIVGNAYPLTRITTTTEVPTSKPIALVIDIPKPVVTLVYSRKLRKSKSTDPVSKSKVIKSVVQIVLWYLDSGCSKHMSRDRSQLTNFVNKFLEDVDLLTGSRGNNLYTLSLGDMMASSLICLLSKASKNKSWLWHRRLSHLNFGAINHLERHSLVRGPALHEMTYATISSGLVPTTPPSTPFVPSSRTNWDILFQLLCDELLIPPPSIDHPALEVIAPIAEVVALEPAASTGSPSSTSVDQDAPSPKVPSDQSSSMDIIHTIMHPDHQISEHNRKWTKDHPFNNIIGKLARPVSTRLQLHEQALFCYYDAFLTVVEHKTYKDALTQSYRNEAMQEELNEFERLEVWELVPDQIKLWLLL
nr:integrase, catalytic region, zinc finger, CCHC-type, peptidase aspartic, catalytic [Tanacetum cinerariifolium]